MRRTPSTTCTSGDRAARISGGHDTDGVGVGAAVVGIGIVNYRSLLPSKCGIEDDRLMLSVSASLPV